LGNSPGKKSRYAAHSYGFFLVDKRVEISNHELIKDMVGIISLVNILMRFTGD